ncbi:hypothetical protein BD626DRAFT_485521 [Schizophyllum amplum]|uniref:Uncharacterized protein n=1 Tax=Schizophyllum amplum TaxID=97359 RepID=A0A550CLK3_9AGAR|nr:hypothetical protein BD626DRAFT_485521 [Auriculariopsis ampla]
MPPETATRSHSLRQSFGRFFPKDSDKEKLAKTKTKEKDISRDWKDISKDANDISKDIPKDFGAKELGAKDLTAKEIKQGRRSTLGARPSGGRPSLGELAQDKTITRRRVSSSRGMSVDEGSPAKAAIAAVASPTPTSTTSSSTSGEPLKRATSLRPRPAASALPKYRPRSGLFDPARAPKVSPLDPKTSPRKPKVPREPSTDDDEKLQETSTSSSGKEKPRAALEVNLTGAIHVSGSPKAKGKAPAPTPTRPAKLHKPASPPAKPSRQGSGSPAPKPSAPKANASPAPKRPGSAASTASARTPVTPVTPVAAAKAVATQRTESPLARKAKAAPSPAPTPPPKAVQDAGNMSDISETSEEEDDDYDDRGMNGRNAHRGSDADSDDDEDDVAALLAPVASPSAPTPSMPRIYTSRTRKTSKVSSHAQASPQTPSRTRRVSSVGKRRSFLAPSTPSRKGSSPRLRTPKSNNSLRTRKTSNASSLRIPNGETPSKSAPRGSILTWEELADASHALDEDDMAAMLADMPAPFRASLASPQLSPVTLDVPLPPESPTSSTTSTPFPPGSPALSSMGLTPATPGGGYGSISQVLLPEVTPSPAPFNVSARFDDAARSFNQEKSARSPGDSSALATLLRLQLASAENTARERLQRLQVLEEELHAAKQELGEVHAVRRKEADAGVREKQARKREAAELGAQLAALEGELTRSMESRERGEEERHKYVMALEVRARKAEEAEARARRAEDEARRAQEDARRAEAEAEEVAQRSSMESTRAAEKAQARALEKARGRWAAASAAQVAGVRWTAVRDIAEGDLSDVRGDLSLLGTLLGQLDGERARLMALRG